MGNIMSVPRQTRAIKLVKIQSEERFATTLEPNLAPGGVTCYREAKGRGYRAATQVKRLSPEIPLIPGADVVHICGRQNFYDRYGQGHRIPAGSETVARYQTDSAGTREAHHFPKRVWGTMPRKNKVFQMRRWESDQFIVVMKRGSACGAKGLAGKSIDDGDNRTVLRNGHSNPMPENRSWNSEFFLKSRMREICKSGSVRGFIADSCKKIFQWRWL